MAAVISRSHDLAVSPGGTEGDKVATVCLVQLYVLAEYVGRFADRANYIVSLYLLVIADILDTMISVVHGRTDQFRKARVEDSELLRLAFLHVKYP